MKKIRLEPLGEVVALPTGRRLLDALLAKDLKVLMSCGGRGICSTCHVHICSGMEQLSPVSPNEKRTLSLVANVTPECGTLSPSGEKNCRQPSRMRPMPCCGR